MNKKESIIVIVCAYNEEDNIENCLKSIRHSILESGSKERFKLVCVDNSSKDNTWDIVSNFSPNGIKYESLKIEHCQLCVSRNAYKFFPQFDYVAYIDGDGGVHKHWCKRLMNNIDSSRLDIISGPVLPITKDGEGNSLWEVFYDSNLRDDSKYIIGANMCYSAAFLEKIDGFPKVFDSRGDETCLLLKARLLGFEKKINHFKNLIAYNHFPNDRYQFFMEQYTDGISSAQIKRLWDKSYLSLIILVFRSLRLLSFISFLFLIPINLNASLLSLVFYIVLSFANMPKFLFRIFKKTLSKSNSSTIIDGLIILFSFWVFDLGFIRAYLSKLQFSKDIILSSSKPIIESSYDQ